MSGSGSNIDVEDASLWGDNSTNQDWSRYLNMPDDQGMPGMPEYDMALPSFLQQDAAADDSVPPTSVSPRHLRRGSERASLAENQPTTLPSPSLAFLPSALQNPPAQAPAGLTIPGIANTLTLPSYPESPVLGDLGNSHPVTTNSYLPPPLALAPPPLSAFAPPPPLGAVLPPAQRAPMSDKVLHSRKAKHRADNDPTVFYTNLPAQLGWGPVKGRSKTPLFEYYKGGPELYPNKRFSKEELFAFFVGAGRPTPRQGMTLWIQHTPSQVNNRYQAASASGKCRYRDCPVPQGTIMKGFYRVAMDEFSDLTTAGTADPFHNAGYLHLHCFEEIFDLGLLLHTAHQFYGFKVVADTRQHRFEDRNPMSLTYHHADMGTIFAQWKHSHQARACSIWPTACDPDSGGRLPRTGVNQKSTLWYTLTRHQLGSEVVGRQAFRQRRGGAHIELHRGDLRRYLQIKEQMKAKASKRKRGEGSDDEDPAAAASNPIRLSWSTSSAGSRSPTPPAPPPRKRKRPAPPKPIDTTAPAANDEFQPDSSWLHNPAPQPPQLSPQDELHRLYTQPTRAATRKRSREAAQAIVNVVATTPRITRQHSVEISGLLAQQPQHVREQVLAAVTPVRPAFLGYDDQLEERLGRLSKRERREVSGFVAKREAGGDGRRIQSYV